eukprot:5288619-Prymnesium_polylepis.1
MREKGTFSDADAVMARAKWNVGKMADASAEHARLACAVTGANVPGPGNAGAARPVANATAPPKPAAKASEQSGGSGDSEALKRIEKAIAAVTAKGGNDESNRAKKKADRFARGRLPDGKWCKSGTCQYNHDKKHPCTPCYSDPRVEVTI